MRWSFPQQNDYFSSKSYILSPVSSENFLPRWTSEGMTTSSQAPLMTAENKCPPIAEQSDLQNVACRCR